MECARKTCAGGSPKASSSRWRAVVVEARRVSDRVIAIVQPVEPVQQKPQGPKVKSLFAD